MTDPQPLTGDELATIKARAEAATPGPWTHFGTCLWREGPLDTTDIVDDCACGNGTGIQRDEDGAHIAGMDPATTLRLVAEIERLQAEVADWKAEWRER
jgi:hypothetical protein